MEDTYIKATIKEEVYSDRSTYIRISEELVEFLNRIEEDNEILAITLDRKESGEIGYNLGLLLKKKPLVNFENIEDES